MAVIVFATSRFERFEAVEYKWFPSSGEAQQYLIERFWVRECLRVRHFESSIDGVVTKTIVNGELTMCYRSPDGTQECYLLHGASIDAELL